MLNADLRDPKHTELWKKFQLISRIAVFRTEWATHDVDFCYSDTFPPKLEARIRSYIAAYLQQPSSPGKDMPSLSSLVSAFADRIFVPTDAPTTTINWESDEMLKQAAWALDTVAVDRSRYPDETEWQPIAPEKQKPKVSKAAQGYFNQLQSPGLDSASTVGACLYYNNDKCGPVHRIGITGSLKHCVLVAQSIMDNNWTCEKRPLPRQWPVLPDGTTSNPSIMIRRHGNAGHALRQRHRRRRGNDSHHPCARVPAADQHLLQCGGRHSGRPARLLADGLDIREVGADSFDAVGVIARDF
jgi:hypothetical protein